MKNLIASIIAALALVAFLALSGCEKRTIFLQTQVRVINQEPDTICFHAGGTVWDILPYDTLQFPMYIDLGKNLVGQDCIYSYEGLPYEAELYGSHFPGEGIVQTGIITPNIWIKY